MTPRRARPTVRRDASDPRRAPVNPAPPDAMFRSEDVNALRVSAAAWLGHMKYIAAMRGGHDDPVHRHPRRPRRCSRGLTSTSSSSRAKPSPDDGIAATTPTSATTLSTRSETGFVEHYLVRMTHQGRPCQPTTFFAHMCAWNPLATRTQNTSVYFLLFAGFSSRAARLRTHRV